jgi:hypothetical protein
VALHRQNSKLVSVIEDGRKVGREGPVGETRACREHHQCVAVDLVDKRVGLALRRSLPTRVGNLSGAGQRQQQGNSDSEYAR